MTVSMIYALMSFICYAFWGLQNGITSAKTDPYTGLFFSGVGYFLSGFIGLTLINFKPNFTFEGAAAGLSLGLMTGIGGLFLLMALQKIPNLAFLIVVTSVYPIGTIALNCMLLKQSIDLQKLIGAAVAVCGLIIMSYRT